MGSRSTAVVQAAGLTKVFRDWWFRPRVVAVDRLDLDIQSREVFGLLGPNGSGKSTTIKMLLGLLYPTHGRISIFGYPPTDVAVKSRIGYLPEETYLYRFLNARETLDYYGRLFQIPRQERNKRVEQLLDMVGLTREARRKVGEYSKGMQRRLGLAQALINDPDLLILDEPTTGLDPIGTREIKNLITLLNRDKRKTILMCSHQLADVEDVCQRLTILYGGRQQTVGETHELLSRQNLTQITTEKLSDATIKRIQELVEQEERHVLSVTAPSDDLETFFLRVVSEAQKARQQTSGAVSTGRIAGFLADGATEGEDLVASLVSAADKPLHEESKTARPAETEAEAPATHIIDELVSAPTQEAADTPAAVEPASTGAEDQVDRGLIDQLVRGDGRPEGGKE
ncbi:MAG TPA: ATP-binding cassette domain-containing protein [Phycisphaerae bacterium]|nr:ATP-binding cassette domain-containing protein [Phycisphaerae bacterium]